MSEINIMDFDPSSSIKSYNFTNTAIRRFYDTIDSEQFKDEKKEKIFEYLTKISRWAARRKVCWNFAKNACGVRKVSDCTCC